MTKFTLILTIISLNIQLLAQNEILNKLKQQFNFNELQFEYTIKVKSQNVANIYNFKNGYAVVSANKNFYPLKAFSYQNFNDTLQKGFKFLVSLLKYDYSKQLQYIKTHPDAKNKASQKWEQWLNGNLPKGDTTGPLLSSLFGQVNCKDDNGNYIYVTNYYTPNHYAVGCVALAFSTVLHYYHWPVNGVSSHTYTDDDGSSNGTYNADYENTTYQWSKMQDRYYGVESTDASRQALGRLAFDCAVSVDMDFESGGSTSNINRVPQAVARYFRYDSPLYMTEGTSGFWTYLDNSLKDKNPVQLAVYTSDGAGHAIVCDGIITATDPADQYYHLNMGWWGNSNGWYQIQGSFNAGGYSIVSAAVMEMTPLPQMSPVNYDVATNQATVSWFYSDRIKNPIYELQQKIGTDDWQTVATNLTDNSYTFIPDIDKEYSFRVKTDKNSDWSEEINFRPADKAAQLEEITVAPTLVTNFINVQYKDLNNSEIKIFSTNGTLIYSKKINTTTTKQRIDLPFMTRGLYIVKVITKDKISDFNIVCQGFKQ